MKTVRIGAGLGLYADSWLWPLAASRGVKFVLSAGGLNPHAARAALALAFRVHGRHAGIATVTGDFVLERPDELETAGEALAHMDRDAPIARVRKRLLFANAISVPDPSSTHCTRRQTSS